MGDSFSRIDVWSITESSVLWDGACAVDTVSCVLWNLSGFLVF